MKSLFLARSFIAACLIITVSATAHAAPLILRNAQIYTVDQQRSWAEAVAINEKGIIVAVGSESDVLEIAGTDAETIDMEGRMILPGFQDVHLHALEAGVNSVLCLFDPFDTVQNYIYTVQDCIDEGKTGEWILGAGVNMVNLLDLHENPIEILDAIAPDRPVLILDDIGHGAWINSVALKAAGYDTVPDAPNGNIILRSDNGKPNGVVLENAPHHLRSLAFPPTEANLAFAYKALLKATEELNANGITSVSDAGGYWPQGHHKVWDKVEANGELTVRASNAFYIYPDKPLDEQIETLKKLYHNDTDRLVRFNQAKIYVDGILSQATGALLEPYEAGLNLEAGEEYGYLYFEEEALNRASRELSALGFQLHFHVTGDYGARLALNAIEQSDPSPGPHRLTHIYLADSADYPRFKELGVIADIQLAPSAVADDNIEFMVEFLGNRAERLMPMGALIDAGALVTMSSDWDADELNPMIKIQTAVSRKVNGIPNVATAIETMTINPAIALRHANKTGSIETGKFADLVILGDNILDMPVGQIGNVEIEGTLLQGKPVFDPAGLFKP